MPGHFPHDAFPAGFGWAPFLLADLFWVMLLGAIVWLVVGGLRRPARAVMPPTAMQPPSSALEILRMRYARGEIDTATFEEMCQRILVSEQQPQQL